MTSSSGTAGGSGRRSRAGRAAAPPEEGRPARRRGDRGGTREAETRADPSSRGSSSRRSSSREQSGGRDRAGRAARTSRPADTPAGPRRRRGRWIAIGVGVLVIAALVWVAVGSRVFDVSGVDVVGAAPENSDAVERAAEVTPGTSVLWLDTSEVAERVRTLPRVASVDVARDWPSRVVVTVSEREPVLALPRGDGVVLVDDTGFAYRTAATRPPGVPVLVLPPAVTPSPDEPATRAAVRVVASLPGSLRGAVTEVRAGGPFAVGFTLTGGREVRWGADADDARKAAVLNALLSRPGTVYDVSTPELAVVR